MVFGVVRIMGGFGSCVERREVRAFGGPGEGLSSRGGKTTNNTNLHSLVSH